MFWLVKTEEAYLTWQPEKHGKASCRWYWWKSFSSQRLWINGFPGMSGFLCFWDLV